MVSVSNNYMINVFYQSCKRPIHKRNTDTYNAECPYCKEGKSAGKKRRFYYVVKENYCYCHNCGTIKSPLDFIKDQTGLSFAQIMAENDNYTDSIQDILSNHEKTKPIQKKNLNVLPKDCINLFDQNQTKYFQNNTIVSDCINYIQRRRLNTAVNRCKTLWVSLTDETHRNRLVFPFYSPEKNAQIDFYQTRAIYEQDEEYGKYISKENGDKTLFNLDKVNPDLDYIFLFEGPIDSMFVKNGVAMGGVHLTSLQEEILNKYYPLHQRIYVLDNQRVDKESLSRTYTLLDQGKTVFLWPECLSKFKDLNEVCVNASLDKISPDFILERASTDSLKVRLELSKIRL